jgi:S1-C subfamily serine protease
MSRAGREHTEPAFSGVFSGTFLSLVLVLAALVWGSRSLQRGGWLGGESAPRPVAPRAELQDEERATIALFEQASRSVVSIRSSNLRQFWGERRSWEVPEGSGSGFLWDAEGHVVTNFHVVRAGTLFTVRFQDGTATRAEFVGAAPDYDLAVLRVKGSPGKLEPIPLGTSADLRVGQRTFAIGYPFGLEQTLTTGVIGGLDRDIQSQSDLAIHGVIQTDAAINPGNSGGPLLDSAGRMIGVNTAIASATGANTGVGFAVPVDTVNRIVPRILNEGSITRAGLGISLAQDFLATERGLEGAVVGRVASGGPADRAGIQGMSESDSGEPELGDVIVGVEGEPIRREADLYQALETFRAGDEVRVRVRRSGDPGRVEEVRVRLAPLR